ncbi:MAG: hypothetical protein JRI76_12535 [Deltaproteobacteria bacterium]|nr:hypothetical protein [Deltaproteobacteria bacterium]MBW2042838.1 hypothetical protein [Deltaproteobacteria bacterium]MBW2132684.1 hypothetical protein [Deltaproteobacteria bacterium]
MQRKSMFLAVISMVAVVMFMAGCAGMTAKPTEKNFKAPTVTLSHVEVQTYWGWWFFSNKIKPAKGKAGNYGAPLDLAFIFEITNPNDFPVKMEKFQFTVGFEDFDVNTVLSNEAMWIPAGKTNQIRFHSIQDARQTQLSLLVTGGLKLKESGKSFWDMLEKWWTQIPDFSFPVHVRGGSAIFKADGVMKSVSFNYTFP